MTMKPSIEIGNRLEQLRLTTGQNPRQFALSNKFDTSVYARIEKGKAGLPEHYLQTILDTYHLNLNWLIKGEGDMVVTSPVTGDQQNTSTNNSDSANRKEESKDAVIDRLSRVAENNSLTALESARAANRILDMMGTNSMMGSPSESIAGLDARLSQVERERAIREGLMQFVLDELAEPSKLTRPQLAKKLGKRIEKELVSQNTHILQKTEGM